MEHKPNARWCPVCHRACRLRGADSTVANSATVEQEFAGDRWSIHIVGTDRIHSQDELLAAYGVDTRIWEVSRFSLRYHEMGSMPRPLGSTKDGWSQGDTQPIVTPLCSIRCDLKKRAGAESTIAILENIKREFAELFPVALDPPPPSHAPTGNVLELNISDHHFGKLAWGRENNDRDWDLSIARDSWRHAVSYVLEGTSHRTFDEVILVVGNDIAHIDGLESDTTAGTRVDSDSRYQKVYCAVISELLWTIRTLKSRGMRVRVVIVPGNHDRVSCFTIGVALELAFEHDPDVCVDNEPTSRKAYAFGKCLVAWEHGENRKYKEKPLNLAVEYPVLWGSTEHREIHTGHVHHIVAEDVQSIIVRQVASLGPNDAWHARSGYLAQRNVEAFMWNKESGLIGTCIYVAPTGRKLLRRDEAA